MRCNNHVITDITLPGSLGNWKFYPQASLFYISFKYRCSLGCSWVLRNQEIADPATSFELKEMIVLGLKVIILIAATYVIASGNKYKWIKKM